MWDDRWFFSAVFVIGLVGASLIFGLGFKLGYSNAERMHLQSPVSREERIEVDPRPECDEARAESSGPVTDEELRRLESLKNSAAPLPWLNPYSIWGADPIELITVGRIDWEMCAPYQQVLGLKTDLSPRPNIEYMLAAANAVPLLIRDIRILRVENDRLHSSPGSSLEREEGKDEWL